ncbi:dipeptidase PepV [Streptococcus urinalis FB127-CNA-2]|uniref:Dipeptidase PepV n=1 Tax=Streptococcus urinalis 2285-97 TaxID=764291 RepID=G5KGL9_9STRE|nr:dipeptidase PepV [Streptococcus urinalis]EHJ57185.1 dipeptidase PepV [Streptococcus urinalis 2285-97]EKS22387.1 dipeptidase PepV [Streptococcus urinalis FB127-CNA-2]VEF32200.1 dipeptidase PepV [Streptococcus urinalis]
MTIDFKAEVAKRQDDLLEDLKSILRINSERDASKADKEHPFGPGPVKALEHFLEMAKRDGYQTRNIENYAGDFEFGQGDEVLGIFGHLDVVPAGSGWDTDPYEPVIKDNKIYARGSSDDKGPTLACYYALKIIKELELPVSKKVRFIVGTDEESGWGDMDYYFAHNGLKDPDFGFSPDAEFPIINGEKGNITEYLHFEGKNEGQYTLVSFKGGLRENMVPESATAVIKAQIELKELQEALTDFCNQNHLTSEVNFENDQFTITINGKSAHGSTPEEGINGATFLAKFLSQFAFSGPAKQYLNTAGNLIHEDFAGKNLGVAYEDAKMGALSMNAGVFQFDKESNDNTIALNFRYPQGTDADTIKSGLEKINGLTKVTLSQHEHTPHYVPMEDELVKTLLSVYEKQTGLEGHEQIIGGGTFGRLLKRGVAFGAMFPGDENTMHQANEYMPLDNIFRSAAIYAEAIYELIK